LNVSVDEIDIHQYGGARKVSVCSDTSEKGGSEFKPNVKPAVHLIPSILKLQLQQHLISLIAWSWHKGIHVHI